MTYTQSLPTEDGIYWLGFDETLLQDPHGALPVVVAGGHVHSVGKTEPQPVADFEGGWWYGPVQGPEWDGR